MQVCKTTGTGGCGSREHVNRPRILLLDADGKDDEGSIVLTQQPAQEAEEIARILSA